MVTAIPFLPNSLDGPHREAEARDVLMPGQPSDCWSYGAEIVEVGVSGLSLGTMYQPYKYGNWHNNVFLIT